MLVALLSSQYARFAAVAEAWLAMGATSFGIWQNGHPVAYWPAGARLYQASQVEPIRIGDQVVADIRVSGLSGPVARARLMADAELISYLMKLEDELQCMTSDLVDSQDQLLALYRLTHSLSQHVTVHETLNALLKEALRLISVQGGFAVSIADANEPVVLQRPTDWFDEPLLWRYFWQSHAEDQEVSLTTINSGDASEDAVHELLLVTIRTRDTITGNLGLFQEPGQSFSTPQIKLVQAVADQASAQLEKVLLYQETLDQTKIQAEMELAKRVQLDLLPHELPRVAGLDIFAYSRPASQVGGDFYDFICQPDRPFTFSIGDVSGKGLSAALLMTMARSAIHSKAQFMPEPTPEVVIRQSNEDLYNDFTQVGVFATAFVGQFNSFEQTITYANAGHSPVVYRAHDRPSILLIADSTAIGILPTSFCKNQEVSLQPGELLIAMTDGFSEARNPADEMFGYERLLYLVDKLADKSAREIADALFDTIDRFGSGCPQDDDQTLVILKGVTA